MSSLPVIPLFILPAALNARAEAIGRQVVAALASGVPCPVYAIDGPGYVDLREAMQDALQIAMFTEIDASTLGSASVMWAPTVPGQLVRCRDGAELLAVADSLPPDAAIGLQAAQADAALVQLFTRLQDQRGARLLADYLIPLSSSHRSLL